MIFLAFEEKINQKNGANKSENGTDMGWGFGPQWSTEGLSSNIYPSRKRLFRDSPQGVGLQSMDKFEKRKDWETPGTYMKNAGLHCHAEHRVDGMF